MTPEHVPAASDGAGDQLRALGYATKFDRTMAVWQNFALGFTYLSPVCGVYAERLRMVRSQWNLTM